MTPEVPAEWQRAVLPACTLAVLVQGPAHGYALAQRLQGAGIGQVRGGALYPVLNRLEQDGLVASSWQPGEGGPGRKVFALSAAGLARLAELRAGWGPFAAAAGAVLSGDDPAARPPSARGELVP